jgi:hypothetical protein
MNRQILGIVLALAATAGHAGAASAEPTDQVAEYDFEGQLGYRGPDGGLVPVVPDEVLVGWGGGRCQFTLQSVEKVIVSRDGTFQVRVSEDTVAYTMVKVFHPDGSTDPATCVGTTSWPCYRFRAEGCIDAIVEFGPKPPAQIIELECPGRVGPRRDG